MVQAVGAMYAALKADDLAAFEAATTKDFYAFERGERMDGDALSKAISEAHAAGNVGAVGDAQGMQPRTWVESASLVYDGNRWRLQFFHSTRVEAK